MIKRVLLAVTLSATIHTQASAESWLCIADMSSGLSYNKARGQWEHAKFNVDGSRFIIKPSQGPNLKYEVHKFGNKSSFPEAFCAEGVNASGYLFCSTLFGQFKFNSKSLRYVKTYVAGFVEITPGGIHKEGEDTPNIEIGRCSKI